MNTADSSAFPPELLRDVARRRTFAIISHPDAGKTTLTEKLLLFGGAIQLAGTVKARKSSRHATSDWMEVEMERGISVTMAATPSICWIRRVTRIFRKTLTACSPPSTPP